VKRYFYLTVSMAVESGDHAVQTLSVAFSLLGLSGSNPAEIWVSVFCVCCVVYREWLLRWNDPRSHSRCGPSNAT
jgi:hypothetical protein